MKKLFLLMMIGLFVFAANAQNVIIPQKFSESATKLEVRKPMTTRTTSDTLGVDGFGDKFYKITFIDSISPTQPSVPIGYWFGVNGFDKGIFAQGFYSNDDVDYQYALTGVLMALNCTGGTSYKVNDPTNGSIAKLKIAMLDDSSKYGNSSISHNIACPGTILGEKEFNIKDIDTTNSFKYIIWHQVDFPTPVGINANTYDPAIIVDLSAVKAANDTLVFCASEKQIYPFDEKHVFIFYPAEPAFWAQYSHIGMERAPAIFPIVDADYVGVESGHYFQGMQLSVFPNPASEQVTIAYGLKKDANNVSINILSASGKLVYTQTEGSQVAGKHNVSFDVSNLSAGTYICNIVSSNGNITKKFVIQ